MVAVVKHIDEAWPLTAKLHKRIKNIGSGKQRCWWRNHTCEYTFATPSQLVRCVFIRIGKQQQLRQDNNFDRR
jgi:hypothetical protein